MRRLLDHPSAQVVGSPGEGRAAGRRARESGRSGWLAWEPQGQTEAWLGSREAPLAVKPRAHHLQPSQSLGQRSSKDSPWSLDPPVASQRSLIRDANSEASCESDSYPLIQNL